MTLQETLRELLSKPLISSELPTLLYDQAELLNGLIKEGCIQEASACSRLRVIYKDLVKLFKEYEQACKNEYFKKPGEVISTYGQCYKESGYKGITWSRQYCPWYPPEISTRFTSGPDDSEISTRFALLVSLRLQSIRCITYRRHSLYSCLHVADMRPLIRFNINRGDWLMAPLQTLWSEMRQIGGR